MQEPQANPAAPGPVGPPQAQPPVGSSPTQATDELFFEGIAKHSANIGTYFWWVGVCILGGGIAFGLLQIEALHGKPLWLLALIGTPMLLWSYLQHITTRYKISRRRVEFQKGVVTRRLDSLELWRVLDVRYEQNLLDRIFDNAKITLIGTDQTHPNLLLYGLPNHRQLFERLREAVQFARSSNRPMELAPGAHEGDVLGHHHH
ncbi:PH domain-containing protein [Nannocystis pusilla]|uniref:PH domain-containing protein n=1 Tax=Nannocystis pusilla TaxID=889268 RepID=A0ABS7TTD2_9BACT|nr:PH domain-containing protein [Nannocystis pusilla]MBZ5711478.1 PH domain-containing protein [Nannocystis pusilla]